ncbi:MAG: succinate dehydrogenase [Desulfococcus sp. 4484_241]|nr:MAG: succinate dehydrogenase [Desulfococcus sp. 4484_241]
MQLVLRIIRTSIGKKLLMAFTGLCFCCFLVIHLAGNLSVYGGADTFNSYVNHLHSLGVLVHIAELALLVLAIVHIVTGTVLFIENLRARPVRYSVTRRSGGRTWGSATMPYTGFLILVFLVCHISWFIYAGREYQTVYQILTGLFSNPVVILLYCAAVLVVALHISHGFWSLFQTFGLNHNAYMPAIRALGIIFAVIVAMGFGTIPLYLGL